MNWNTISKTADDNLQVFVVFKFSDVSGSNIRDAIFGHDDDGWDRFVSLKNNALLISGVKDDDKSGSITISTFPKDTNPLKTDRFCVLSVHWNNRGSTGCGENNSSVWCNGKNLKSFTAGGVAGDKSFSIGVNGSLKYYPMKGEIGRFLVCGNRAHPMGEEEITIVHNYLMKEWQINEKGEKQGPAGPRGLPGPQGPRGIQGP